jgi:glycosyltransferase involved in cell wall biosynthesis
MRVVIFEQKYKGGHFLSYVARLVEAISDLASEIVLAMPAEAEESEQFRVHLAPLRERFRLHAVPDRLRAGRVSIVGATARMFRELIGETKPDAVYVPTADGTAEALGLARMIFRGSIPSSVHAEALLIRVPHAYGMRDDRRPLWLVRAAMRNMPFGRVHFIDPVIFDWVKQTFGNTLAKRSHFIADPIEPFPQMSMDEARQALELPSGVRIVSTIGMHDRRKGTDVLLDAVEQAKLAEDVRVLIAGPLTNDMKQILATHQSLIDSGRVLLRNGYLSNAAFQQVILASDLVCTPYRPQPHPSGIVLQSAAARRMVLSSDQGWFKYIVPKFQLGHMCDATRADALAAALMPALDAAPTYARSAIADRLVEFHAPSNFAMQWRAGLAEMMGRTKAPGKATARTWDWVIDG